MRRVNFIIASLVIVSAIWGAPASGPAQAGQFGKEGMEAAEACVLLAHMERNTKLDYSVESIKVFDGLLEKIHKEFKDTPKERMKLEVRAVSYGAYIGEVVRRQVGGSWEGEKGKLVFKTAEGKIIDLTPWVTSRIYKGQEESIVGKVDNLLKTKGTTTQPTTQESK